MKTVLFFAGLILAIALVLGCTGSEQKVVCNAPYILVGADCCLDNNNNSMCDKDETTIIQTSETEETTAEEPVIEEEPKTCTSFGCLADKPKYCKSGNVIYSCLNCGCPTPGMRCDNVTGKCSEDCIDGTKYGQCSSTKPNYCSNGELIEKCDKCGCPGTAGCGTDGTCGTCSDGTNYGACSITKPKSCNNGKLEDSCLTCGCPSGLFCHSDDSCGTTAEESEVVYETVDIGFLIGTETASPTGWQSCDTIDGGWAAARKFCQCQDYDDVAAYGTGNSCYIELGTNYHWSTTTSCPMAKASATSATGGVSLIKCQTAE